MASIASDVIREIRENPDVREEVRRLILTDELLAMPARSWLGWTRDSETRWPSCWCSKAESLDRMDARQDRMEETPRAGWTRDLLAQQMRSVSEPDSRTAGDRTGWTRAKIGRKGARIGWKRFRAGQALFWIV